MAEKLDRAKLPPGLEWVAAPAERYGRLQFDDRIRDYLQRANPQERDALRELSRRWESEWEQIDAWLTPLSISEHPEARLVYFTQCLLGTGADTGLL